MLAAVLPFVGVVAAFGIAPDTVTEKIELTRVIEEVTLAHVPAAPVAEETYWREERIQRGDTFASLLARLKIEDAAAVRFLRLSAEAKGLRQLVPGRMMRAHTTEEGRLVELRYSTGLMMLTVKPDGDTFRLTEQVAPLERRVMMK
jgi:cell envelope opacity-associated protein A